MNHIGISDDIEAIKRLKARYFRGMDMKDEPLFRSTFSPDVVLDARGSTTDPLTGNNPFGDVTGDVVRGIDNLVSAVFANLPDISVHQAFLPEIDIVDSDHAKGIWPMEDLLLWREGPLVEMRGYGHYHETYERRDGAWKISTLRLTRLYLTTVPRRPEA